MADDQDAQVFTPDDEPLMHKITRALKSAFGGGRRADDNLPDEQEDTPRRRAAFAQEQSDDAIKSLQGMGERIRKATAGESIRENKRRGMTDEQATRAALRRQ